jgi:hypothetical protein
VNDKQYTRARVLYLNAEGAIDGWVKALRTEIIMARDSARPDQTYTESLNAAAGQAQQFITYAQGLLSKGSLGSSIIADFLKVLADSAIKVWENYRSANREQKEAILKEIDDLKWQPFDAIKTGAK